MRRGARRSRTFRHSINASYAKGKFSHVSADELAIYTMNDSDLYKTRVSPIQKNLSLKWKKGTYNPEKAVVLWKYATDDAAKRYDQYAKFTPDERRAAAIQLERQWRAELKAGNDARHPKRI